MIRSILNTRMVNRVIFILSLIGVAIAIYVLQSWLRNTSIICLTNGCETVKKSPASYLFGIPVPAVGLVGYTILAICAFAKTTNLSPRLSLLASRALIGMSTFGILFVSWFTYTELFIIRAICTWCAVSAVNMFVMFFLIRKHYTWEQHT